MNNVSDEQGVARPVAEFNRLCDEVEALIELFTPHTKGYDAACDAYESMCEVRSLVRDGNYGEESK